MDELYKKVIESLYDGVYFVDRKRKITLWNKSAERLTGYSADEVVGQFCFDNILDHIDRLGNHLCFGGCPLHACMEDREPREAAVYLKHKNGTRIPVVVKVMPIVEDDEVIGAVEIFSDNYQYFKTLKELGEFRDKAFTDQLTGLPNRHYLEEFLNENEFFGRKTLSVLFADIDDFKYVNDTYGHDYGDVVLKEVSKAIKGSIKKSDEVFRYGGEEFMALVFDDDPNQAKIIAERIRGVIEDLVIKHDEERTPITISVGITMMSELELLHDAIDRADKLMYKSKVSGKNKVSYDM